MNDAELPLPELQDALLDEATLDRLVADLGLVATDLSVRLKAGAEVLTGDQAVSLADGVEALRSGTVLGLQVRYRHANQRWCDTLLRTAGGVRLVRIQLEGL